MSQPSLREKFDDEQFLSCAFAIELKDVEKTLFQLKLEKFKPKHSGPFCLNVDYYFKKIFKEMDNVESRVQKLNRRTTP